MSTVHGPFETDDLASLGYLVAGSRPETHTQEIQTRASRLARLAALCDGDIRALGGTASDGHYSGYTVIGVRRGDQYWIGVTDLGSMMSNAVWRRARARCRPGNAK